MLNFLLAQFEGGYRGAEEVRQQPKQQGPPTANQQEDPMIKRIQTRNSLQQTKHTFCNFLFFMLISIKAVNHENLKSAEYLMNQ